MDYMTNQPSVIRLSSKSMISSISIQWQVGYTVRSGVIRSVDTALWWALQVEFHEQCRNKPSAIASYKKDLQLNQNPLRQKS